VIVRVANEGQYRVPDDDVARLNELDNQAVAAAEAKDEQKFNELWQQMLAVVANDGHQIGDDELVSSDVILPPRDITFEEACAEFTGEGLVPD
jgi:PspAA-like protein